MQTHATRSNVRFEILDGADHAFRDLYIDDIADTTTAFGLY